jgi:DNA-binding MarR family transcriptional regulator
LIRRKRGTSDRRVITTTITTAGLDLLRSLDQPVEKFQRKLLGHLGERRLQSLIRLLETARSGRNDHKVQKPLIAKKVSEGR